MIHISHYPLSLWFVWGLPVPSGRNSREWPIVVVQHKSAHNFDDSALQHIITVPTKVYSNLKHYILHLLYHMAPKIALRLVLQWSTCFSLLKVLSSIQARHSEVIIAASQENTLFLSSPYLLPRLLEHIFHLYFAIDIYSASFSSPWSAFSRVTWLVCSFDFFIFFWEDDPAWISQYEIILYTI